MSLRSFLSSLSARERGREESAASSAKGYLSVEAIQKSEDQARTGRQDALDKLIETLKSESRDLQWAAQSALARVGMPAFDGLVSALHSSEFDLYFGAEQAIVQMQDPGLFPRLVPLLTSTNDNVRWLVAGIFGKLKDPQAIRVLGPCLGDSCHMVRVEAVASLKALGWQPQSEQERAVCAAAAPHADVVTSKYQDAVALGKSAFEPLTVALLSGNWVMAEQAARALAQIGDESVLPALESTFGWNIQVRGALGGSDTVRELSFRNVQREALMAIVTILIRLERLRPRKDEELERVPAASGSLDRSAPLEQVKTADDLKVGDVIRVWHDYLGKWATGWLEVMSLQSPLDLVCLRSLPGKELLTRGICDTVGSAWRWPIH